MKKLFILLLGVLGLFVFLPTLVRAQRGPSKDMLIVDYFSRTPAVSMPYLATIRNEVMAAFIRRGRYRVVDAESVAALQGSSALGLFVQQATPYAIQEAARVRRESRLEAIRSTGTRYLVSGVVTQCAFKQTGQDAFSGEVTFWLCGYDLAQNEQLEPQTIHLTGSGASATEALRKALEGMAAPMEQYINRNYKFTTRILELAEPDRKGRRTELYVHCGTEMGVRRGDLFLVYEQTEVGGVSVQKEIGKLRVREVQGPDVALCVISRGDEQIGEAFDSGRPLTVVSDMHSLF